MSDDDIQFISETKKDSLKISKAASENIDAVLSKVIDEMDFLKQGKEADEKGIQELMKACNDTERQIAEVKKELKRHEELIEAEFNLQEELKYKLLLEKNKIGPKLKKIWI